MTLRPRPALRYHGGKWRLAPWILQFFPPHRIYVEPFGGGASVLLQKPRAYAEVYNDLDTEVVNVFQVLRDQRAAARLTKLLLLTPFSRTEFRLAYRRSRNAIEQARRTILKSFAGFGSAAIHDGRTGMRTHASTHWTPPTGFRANSNRSGTTPAADWSNYPEHVAAFCARLQGVVIENSDAVRVIENHDTAETLFYVDPPYPHSTRTAIKKSRRGSKSYTHEMTDGDHRTLAAKLSQVSGMVVVSGYPCDLYDLDLYSAWERHETKHRADAAKLRTEVVWLNAACSAARAKSRSQLDLMETA